MFKGRNHIGCSTCGTTIKGFFKLVDVPDWSVWTTCSLFLPSFRCHLSWWPSPLWGPVYLLNLFGNIRGACLNSLRSQLLQGLPAGLLEPQQEVPMSHVQENLLQKTRDECQPGPGWDILPVPGTGDVWGCWRKPLTSGLNEFKFRPRTPWPQQPQQPSGHWRVCPAWRGSLRRLYWKEVKGP